MQWSLILCFMLHMRIIVVSQQQAPARLYHASRVKLCSRGYP
jgi:hypothetical protein